MVSTLQSAIDLFHQKMYCKEYRPGLRLHEHSLSLSCNLDLGNLSAISETSIAIWDVRLGYGYHLEHGHPDGFPKLAPQMDILGGY